jgi:hypothetical protein
VSLQSTTSISLRKNPTTSNAHTSHILINNSSTLALQASILCMLHPILNIIILTLDMEARPCNHTWHTERHLCNHS